MAESYWINPDGEILYAPDGHYSFIREHGAEYNVHPNISLRELMFQGWIRISDDMVVIDQVSDPQVFNSLRNLLLSLSHKVYYVWIGHQYYAIPYEKLEKNTFQEIYKEMLSGEISVHVADASDAESQGMFEYQDSWQEANGDGSTAVKDKGVEFMPQDKTKEVWWERELLDYKKKNFPGKKDVIPPEDDNGYPAQASDVVNRLKKKAVHGGK
jgi:hypothetical protein